MKVCIIQPSYIPWKGYFHQIAKSDFFIFYDTVQYDKRGWRNRNQIKTPKGSTWLTIPVQAHGSHDGLLIQDVQIQDPRWSTVHLQKIQQNYLKAPCFEKEFPWIQDMLTSISQQHTDISRIAAETTKLIAHRLGLHNTQFIYASDLLIKTDNSSLKLLKIIEAVGGTEYLSGPSAQTYLNTTLFEKAAIPVEWMQYNYPEYPQLYAPFTHQVSILDLILMVGSEQAGTFIWDKQNASCQVLRA